MEIVRHKVRTSKMLAAGLEHEVVASLESVVAFESYFVAMTPVDMESVDSSLDENNLNMLVKMFSQLPTVKDVEIYDQHMKGQETALGKAQKNLEKAVSQVKNVAKLQEKDRKALASEEKKTAATHKKIEKSC